jgi:hypothetical protein
MKVWKKDVCSKIHNARISTRMLSNILRDIFNTFFRARMIMSKNKERTW